MEQIYTIPVNEAFELCESEHTAGCPLCSLYNKLEDDELELILGASMMEPDIRIVTNREGFCRVHYDMMFTRKNRLGMALTLESHLSELAGDLKGGGLFAKPGERSVKRIAELENSCYVCRRIDFHFTHMVETVVFLWDEDEDFRRKFSGQTCFCLPHYRRLLACASERLSKKRYPEFEKITSAIVKQYLEELSGDVSWFCKKFDYRYADEPWNNSKDSVERSIRFLRSDLHNPQSPLIVKKKKDIKGKV